MSDLTLSVQLKADGSGLVGEFKLTEKEADKFRKTLGKTEKQGKKTGDTLGKAGKKVNKLQSSLQNTARSAALLEGPLGGVAGRISVLAAISGKGHLGLLGLAAGTAAVTSLMAKSIGVYAQTERQLFRLEAQTRATGNASGFSTRQLDLFARDLARNTLASSKGVREAIGVMLTFKAVSGDAFTTAIKTAQDMAAVMGGDVKSAALQLGKALEDPNTGLNALKRSGVSFSAEQRRVIKSMVETGQQGKAMALILEAVRGQLGPAAQAEARGYAGAVDTLGQSWEELLEKIEQTTVIGNILKSVASGFDAIGRSIAPDDAQRLNNLLTEELALQKKIGVIKEQNRYFYAIQGENLEKQLAFVRLQIKTHNDRVRRENEVEQKLIAEGKAKADKKAAEAQVDRERKLQLKLQGVRAQSQVQLVQEQSRQALAGLDDQLQNQLISYQDYYNQRTALQVRAVQQEERAVRTQIQLAKDEGASKDQLLVLEQQLILLSLKRSGVATQGARDQAAAERSLVQELEAVKISLLEAQGNGVQARMLELKGEYGPLLEQLKQRGDAAGIALVNKLINVELAGSRLDELKDRVDRVLAQTARDEQRLDIQVDTGVLTELQARQQLLTIHQKTATELEAMLPNMRELVALTGNPQAAEGLRAMESQIASLRVATDQTAIQINGAFQGAFSQTLSQIGREITSLEDLFVSFTQTILQSLQQIAAEQIAKSLFTSASGGIGGFLSSFLGSASVAHTGAIVGLSGGSSRQVNPMMFANASRYHDGGFPGLRANEVPTILKKREEVLTPDDPRNALNGGADGGATGINIINVTDESMVADYMDSSRSDSVFINKITRNSGAIKQLLGG